MINRREFLVGSLVLTGYATMGGSNVFALPVNDAKVKAVSMRITCTMEILKPPRSKNINIWTPIPPDNSEQKISNLSVKSRIQYKMTEDASNKNKMFFFNTDKLVAGETITMRYTMVRKMAEVVEDRDERPERHLEPSEWERWDDNIARYVDKLVGKENDPIKIGRKIYDALIDSLNYVHEACGRGVSTLMFEEKIGRCDEFHALFRSMMMYKKIPVKWEQGIALPYPSVIKKVETLYGAQTLFSFCFIYPDGSGGNLTTADSASSSVTPEYIERSRGVFELYRGKGIALAVPEVPVNARLRLLKLGSEYSFFRAASFTTGELEEVMKGNILSIINLIALNIDEAGMIAFLLKDGGGGGSLLKKQLKRESEKAKVAEKAIELLHGVYPPLLVTITAGKHGSWGWDGKRLSHIPAVEVDVVSTAGAGDAFLAGIIAGIVVELPIAEAQELATLVASLSVTSPHTIHKGINRSLLKQFYLDKGVALSERVKELIL